MKVHEALCLITAQKLLHFFPQEYEISAKAQCPHKVFVAYSEFIWASS